MSTVDRKAELERKKARLAAIREEKKRKDQLSGGAAASPERSAESSGLSQREDVDKMLAELGIPPNNVETPVDENVDLDSGTPRSSPGKQTSSQIDASPATHYRTRGRINLQKSETVQVNLLPKEQVLYNKTTQTIIDTGSVDKDFVPTHTFEWDDEFHAAPVGTTAQGSMASPSEEVFDFDASPTHQIAAGLLPHIELIRPVEVSGDKKQLAEEEKKQKIAPLSEEEKQTILSSDDFCRFFDRASRVLERAITDEVDIFVDYAKGIDQDKIDTGAQLALSRCFFDDKWTKNRCVTCLDYSPQHPELLAVSYNNQEDSLHEPDGVVAVWNTKFKTATPEYVFHCQSRVLAVSWAKFHPNLLIGGTYSGQICLWDNRNNKRTPVQKSPLSAAAHTHPVFCLQVVGTQNAHNIVSVSTDGKFCSWSMDMLAQPQESYELAWKQNKRVSGTSLSFPQNDVNNYIVGGEDGSIYSGCRHGQKAGILESYDGHTGPVTGVHCHSAAMGQVDFSHLFLSSSFDWTVKLWNSKETKPLYSFEDHSDYVFDVAWSPIHPALFACVDGRGRIDLWQLNQDTELPAASIVVPDSPALNKVLWLHSGYQLAVGDDTGKIWIYDVNEQLATPKPNEWQAFAKALNELKQAQVEAEEYTNALASTTTTMR